MKDIKFKDKIAQGINDLFYIWKREFQTTFRDQGVLIFFILVPLGYPLLYSFIYDNEVVREVPAVVVDDSHSSLSREYLRKVDATPDIQIVAYCADMEEAKQMLKNRLAYGIIYIPSDFSDNIAKGKQTQVSIYCDMSGLLYYKSMLIANTAVSLDMNKDIKIARSGNTTERQDEITGYPIEYEEISIFNPTAGFAAFLIPAVLVLIARTQPETRLKAVSGYAPIGPAVAVGPVGIRGGSNGRPAPGKEELGGKVGSERGMGETGGHARKGVKVGLDGEQGNGKVAPLLRPTELFGAFFRQTQLLGTQAFLFGFGGALLRQAELFGMFFRQTQLLGTLPTFGCQAAEFGKAFLLGGGHCTLMRKDLLQLGSAKFAPVALLDDAVEVVFHQYLNPAEQGEELGKHEVVGNSAMQSHQLPFTTVEDTGIVDDFQHFPAAGKRCAGIGKGTEPLPVLANVGCPHRVAPRKAEYRIKVVSETVGATASKTFVMGVAALYGAVARQSDLTHINQTVGK